VHSVLFGCLTKLGAKRAELEEKFVPRSHVEHSQRTHPIHPIGQYTDVLVRSYYLGAFGTVWLHYETRFKTCRTSAKFRATKWRRNFSQRMHQIHPLEHKTDVLECFVLFGCISGPLGCLTKLGAKRAELVQNFVPRSRVGIFRNECTRSTPIDPKLTFWCILYYLGAFETI